MYAERGNGLIEFLSHVEDEIERRKRLFAVSGVFDIAAYNKVASEPLPVTFFVLDDLLKNLALLKDILWLYNPTIERFCEFLRVSKPLGISFVLSGDADYSGEFARMLRSCGREVVSVCLKGCAKYGFCGGDNTVDEKSVFAIGRRSFFRRSRGKRQRQTGNLVHRSAYGRGRSQSFCFVNPQKI